MEVENPNINTLVKYRVAKAYEVYKEAQDVAGLHHWNLAANRLYYAVFHICHALTLANGIIIKSHNGILRSMGQNFIKIGKLSESDGKLMNQLFRMRQTGDYDDLYDWSESKVKPLFEPTHELIRKIEKLIEI